MKVSDKESKIKRKIISKFGETLYLDKEVKGVLIRVDFKDGSSISYRRDEDDDDFEDLIEK